MTNVGVGRAAILSGALWGCADRGDLADPASVPDGGVVAPTPSEAGVGMDAARALPQAVLDASPSWDGSLDAGPWALDSSLGSSDSAAGPCAGGAPHSCYRAKPGNPDGCPPLIHEQSDLYPPLEEWEACSSPSYAACIYLRPDGTEANCSCDLGFHWLCFY